MKIQNIKQISKELEEGATLAFYSKKKWFTKIIPFFTQESKNENPPLHVGICYNITRNEKECKFYFSEQGFHGGKYIKVVIKNDDDYYFFFGCLAEELWLINRLNNYDKIIIKNLKKPLTEKQIENGIIDAKSQIGKKYNYIQFFFAAEFFEKILPKFILQRLSKSNLNICSTHVLKNYYKIDVLKNKLTGIVSPNELIKLDIFK
jgi:hypothetical protein